MTFLADEGVDRQIVERLRLDGHEVSYLAEMAPGIMDEVVLSESQNPKSVLITADKDFGELVFRQRKASTGVLLIRLWGLAPATKVSVVSNAIQEHGRKLPGAFAVRASFGKRRSDPIPRPDSNRLGYSGQQASTHIFSVVRFHVSVRPVMYGSSSVSNREMSVSRKINPACARYMTSRMSRSLLR